MKDDLGDRMKKYEAVAAGNLSRRTPLYARLDGRGFSRFTKRLKKPYSSLFLICMNLTAMQLVKNSRAVIAFNQSDEISLLWPADNETNSTIFNRRSDKLHSTLAGLASSTFNYYATKLLGDEYGKHFPHFDCRVINLPNEDEAANMFVWRSNDCTRNAIQSCAQFLFSSKELFKIPTNKQLEMINEKEPDLFHKSSH